MDLTNFNSNVCMYSEINSNDHLFTELVQTKFIIGILRLEHNYFI